jgi:hypothetical protein
MKLLKRMLCVLLCVVILSTTVGTKYFDSNHMEKVEATTIVIGAGITLATLFEFCLFVGTTALAAYGIYEGYENREEIARFGKEFIDSCGDTVDGWVAQFVDASGQDYVFGSEALELVRDTEWSVIQGGMPPEGDPNKKDDKDKDKFHIPGDYLSHVAQFTALGATWFTTNARNIYQEWCDILDGWIGKDAPIPANNVLANNFPRTISDADIAAQWSGEPYAYGGTSSFNYQFQNSGETSPHYCQDTYYYDKASSVPVCGFLNTQYAPRGVSFVTYTLDENGLFEICTMDYTRKEYQTYKGSLAWSDTSAGSGYNVSNSYYPIFSYAVNFPVFSTMEDCQNYLLGLSPATGALNYGQTYRIADWLQQDWAGTLIDPLVNIGLTLSQLIDVMKALGLKTLQGLTAQQLLELLKNVLPKLDPALLPGADPTPIVVDPAVDPVYYPDPDAHPDKPPRPVIDPDPGKKPDPDPGTDPDPKPDPKPDPDPGTDPDPKPDPDPAPLPDMDAADYKVELTGVFPFCIPFDFIALLKTLDAAPRAPCFDFPVVIPALDYREDVKLDLSIFDDVAKVIRLCEKVSFILFLMFVTSKVIRW